MIPRMLCVLAMMLVFRDTATGGVIEVPGSAPSIELAVERAIDGDTILIAPGTYKLNLHIRGKAVNIASHFITTGDTSFVRRTVLDGAGQTVLDLEEALDGSAVIGLTVRNGDDGIMAGCRMLIADCIFTGNQDAIDYEGGGGVCRDCSFTGNHDDAIDLDGPVGVRITGNRIWANGDDGIEIRLHPYEGPVLETIIMRNTIHANGEDGIQFIDYATDSDRRFVIERNLITGNAMSGVGCMGNENTVENYEAFPVPEEIVLLNNTFAHNNFGVTGGARLALVNNIIVATRYAAVKGVTGRSLIARNLFWNNGDDFEGSDARRQDNVFADPMLTGDYSLAPDSPAAGSGTARIDWNGQRLLPGRSVMGDGEAVNIGAY